MQDNSNPKERKTEGRTRCHRDVAGTHTRQKLQTGNPANESQQGEEDRERGAEQSHATKTAARELSLRHAGILPERGRLSKILHATSGTESRRRVRHARKRVPSLVVMPVVKIGASMSEDRHTLSNRLERFPGDVRNDQLLAIGRSRRHNHAIGIDHRR